MRSQINDPVAKSVGCLPSRRAAYNRISKFKFRDFMNGKHASTIRQLITYGARQENVLTMTTVILPTVKKLAGSKFLRASENRLRPTAAGEGK